MRSPRVFFTLDPSRHEELSARAKRLGIHPNVLARDMLLTGLEGQGEPGAISAKIDRVLHCLSGDGRASALTELRDRVSDLHEGLGPAASGPGHDALWDLLETVLEWAIRTCVCVDHLVGFQLNDRDKYRHFNRRTAETSRRLLEAALKGARDG